MLGDGTGVLAVIIEFFRGEGDFPGVNDEFVGRTDVFMEHSFGKTDGGFGRGVAGDSFGS